MSRPGGVEMPGRWAEVSDALARGPRRWLVTGAAGFIGSHLVEALLRLGQEVVALDDLSTGSRRNLEAAAGAVPGAAGRLRTLVGDVCRAAECRAACEGVEYVLHQAAIASVPRSLADPAETERVNVGGTVTLLRAAREAGVRRVVAASSSAVYGDRDAVVQREDAVGRPLSPYALSKRTGEQWGELFGRMHGLEVVWLRYFNVFGPRQDPAGPYAAVIPAWTRALLAGEPCIIHGDGGTTRDLVPVADVVRANLLAAVAPLGAGPRVFNVGSGRETSLSQLFTLLRAAAAALRPEAAFAVPCHGPARPGDVRRSRADLSRISGELGFSPNPGLAEALAETVRWYAAHAPMAAARV